MFMRHDSLRDTATAETAGERRSQRGFTMIELVLAMVVLIVGVGGVYLMTCSMSRERQLGEERQRAFLACQRRLADLRDTTWAQVPGLDGSTFDVDTDGNGVNELRATAVSGHPGTLRVVQFAASGAERIYRVTATASWIGVGGQQTFSLETLLSNRYAQ